MMMMMTKISSNPNVNRPTAPVKAPQTKQVEAPKVQTPSIPAKSEAKTVAKTDDMGIKSATIDTKESVFKAETDATTAADRKFATKEADATDATDTPETTDATDKTKTDTSLKAQIADFMSQLKDIFSQMTSGKDSSPASGGGDSCPTSTSPSSGSSPTSSVGSTPTGSAASKGAGAAAASGLSPETTKALAELSPENQKTVTDLLENVQDPAKKEKIAQTMIQLLKLEESGKTSDTAKKAGGTSTDPVNEMINKVGTQAKGKAPAAISTTL
jgi:hypothetical protein